MKKEEGEGGQAKKPRLHFGSLEAVERRRLEEAQLVPSELLEGQTVDADRLFDGSNAGASSPPREVQALAAAPPGFVHVGADVREPLVDGEAPRRSNRSGGIEIDEEMRDSEAARRFEFTRAARAAAAPAADPGVKRELRNLGEPAILFGEGPYERRERLKKLMAQRVLEGLPPLAEPRTTTATGATSAAAVPAAGTAVVVGGAVVRAVDSLEPEVQKKTLFYSEGTDELRAARIDIARFSLPRAALRLKRERHIQLRVDPLELEDRVKNFVDKVASTVESVSSQIGEDRPLTCGKFSPDSNIFATASWGPVVKLWNVPNCDLHRSLRGHSTRVNTLAWRRSGESPGESGDTSNKDVAMTDADSSSAVNLASGAADGEICLWNINKSDPVARLTGHEERVNRVEFHPSGTYLASTSHDETWRLWDVTTQTELLVQEGHTQAPFAMKFHSDGSLLVVGDLSGNIRVWDLRVGRVISSLTGHVKQVLSIDAHPQIGHQFASSSEDNTVLLWDLRKQRTTSTILAHDKMVTYCGYEPTYGRYLVTAAFDNRVKLWAVPEWRCFKLLEGHEGRIMNADISPDGKMIGTVGFDRTWKLWMPKEKLEKEEEDETKRDYFADDTWLV